MVTLESSKLFGQLPAPELQTLSQVAQELSFAPGEQIYNQNNKNGRPDFAPTAGDYGVCFVVEDKATGFELVIPDTLPATEPPTTDELHVLRTRVDPDGRLRH